MPQGGLQLTAKQPHLAPELSPIVGVLEDLPCPEQPLADVEPKLAELLLDGESFRVGGEVTTQVRPADLSTRQGQVAIGPPAI